MCLATVFGVACNGSGIAHVDVVMGERDEARRQSQKSKNRGREATDVGISRSSVWGTSYYLTHLPIQSFERWVTFPSQPFGEKPNAKGKRLGERGGGICEGGR